MSMPPNRGSSSTEMRWREHPEALAADAPLTTIAPLNRPRGTRDGTTSSFTLQSQGNQHERRGGCGGASGGHPRWSESNGCYTTTKAGLRICDDFQVGRCARAASNNRCPHDGGAMHQCNICSMVGHGANQTDRCPMQEGQPFERQKGASKGTPCRKGGGGKGGKAGKGKGGKWG